MDNWFDSMPGGTHYVGHCHNCGKPNDTCSDGLCEKCIEAMGRECPTCGCNYDWTEMSSSGQCKLCDEADMEELGYIQPVKNRLAALDIDLTILNV